MGQSRQSCIYSNQSCLQPNESVVCVSDFTVVQSNISQLLADITKPSRLPQLAFVQPYVSELLSYFAKLQPVVAKLLGWQQDFSWLWSVPNQSSLQSVKSELESNLSCSRWACYFAKVLSHQSLLFPHKPSVLSNLPS